MQKLGFSHIKELPYDDYFDNEGLKPFKDLQPNQSCIVWAKNYAAQEGNND
jgi:hypothetical protein